MSSPETIPIEQLLTPPLTRRVVAKEVGSMIEKLEW
jgi:hypothetical protein